MLAGGKACSFCSLLYAKVNFTMELVFPKVGTRNKENLQFGIISRGHNSAPVVCFRPRSADSQPLVLCKSLKVGVAFADWSGLTHMIRKKSQPPKEFLVPKQTFLCCLYYSLDRSLWETCLESFRGKSGITQGQEESVPETQAPCGSTVY